MDEHPDDKKRNMSNMKNLRSSQLANEYFKKAAKQNDIKKKSDSILDCSATSNQKYH
jgi:hypothetical protein